MTAWRAVSLSAAIRWLVLATLVASDAVGLRLTGMRLAPHGLLKLCAVLFLLLGLAIFYARLRPSERLVDLVHTAAQLLVLFAAAAVLSYVLATSDLPLQDRLFARADAFLGFDWLAWFHWVHAHPALHLMFYLAYMSPEAQLIGLVVYLALTGRSARNRELIWTLTVSLLLILPLSAVLPGVSAYGHFDVVGLADAAFVPEFISVRSGAMAVIHLSRVQGIITFPSFHTTLAFLFLYAARGNRPVFTAAAVLNGLMLLAIPSEGGHYLVDVIAGALVAGCAAWAAAAIEARLAGRPALVAEAVSGARSEV